MDAFGLLATIVVLLGVATLILLFEKKRAKQIQRDLEDMAREDQEPPESRSREP